MHHFTIDYAQLRVISKICQKLIFMTVKKGKRQVRAPARRNLGREFYIIKNVSDYLIIIIMTLTIQLSCCYFTL